MIDLKSELNKLASDGVAVVAFSGSYTAELGSYITLRDDGLDYDASIDLWMAYEEGGSKVASFAPFFVGSFASREEAERATKAAEEMVKTHQAHNPDFVTKDEFCRIFDDFSEM